jgi:hypothetical protein
LKFDLLATALLAALGLFAVGQAHATNQFVNLSTRTDLDGGSIEIDGTLTDSDANALPWVAELYARAGECVRFFITLAGFDAELTVISPDGTVFRDDDGGGSLRPLVEIGSAPATGWYTVQVATFNGLPALDNFALKYGRYPLGNPNCANPTQPFSRVKGGGEHSKQPAVAEPVKPTIATDPAGAR